MSTNLGQVAAILYGTTAPTNKDVIWAKTSTNDPDTWVILGYYENISSSWERLSGIHEGALAPNDLTKIWKKPNGQTFSLNVYDSNTEEWVNLLNIPTVVLNSNLTIADDSYSGNVISNQSVNDYIIELENTIPVDTIFLIERIGTGAISITVSSGLEINGIDGASFDILHQYTSVSVRCYAAGKFIIEGNTI